MNKKVTISTIIIFIIGAGALYTSLKEPTQDIEIQPTPVVKENTEKINENNKNNSYSLSEIALHKTEDDCWTSINGKVYNITKVIPNHPAGKEKIMKGCGIDATTIFSRVPKHDLDLLTQSIIGDLK